MIEIYLFVAVVLVAAGAGIGVIAVLALGIRREEHGSSLTGDVSDRVSRGARVLNGVHTHGLAKIDRPLAEQAPEPPPNYDLGG